MEGNKISRQQMTLIKGVAIMAIVLHNWCHVQPYSYSLETERYFSAEKFDIFMSNVMSSDHIFSNIFSIWGWFGIFVFMFATGYGLTAKHEYPETKFGVKSILACAKKFWKLLIPALLLTYLQNILNLCFREGYGIGEALTETFKEYYLSSILNLTFLDDVLKIIPRFDIQTWGPWWYFSLTLQFYVIYIFLHRYRSKALLIALAVVSLIPQGYFSFEGNEVMQDYLRSNSIGFILPFCYGIWYRRYGGVNLKLWMVPCLLILFYFAHLNWVAWLILPLVVLVPAFHYLPRIATEGVISRVFLFIGSISAYIFVIHPMLRRQLMSGRTIVILAYVALTIASAYLLKKLLQKLGL